jgi:hypothetical protein
MPVNAQVTEQQAFAELVEAERQAGWLAACEKKGRHLVVTQELVTVLAEQLGPLSRGPVLEVCAGRGELAAALQDRDVDLVCTDTDPPAGSPVIRLDAFAALARFQPTTVVGSFVPVDSGIDQAVLADQAVKFYLVLGARLSGQLGSPQLWSACGWTATPLPQVTEALVTRHDVWLGEGRGILRRGEAWLFRRAGKVK